MFIQVIRGNVKDAAAVRAASDEWDKELKPGAKGYLGSTEGVTDDGKFIAVVRFESEEAANANSARPEQGAWWEKTSKLIDGASFYNCPRVESFMGGGSDDAGFVQIMSYKPSDVDKLVEMTKQFAELPMDRKDILGGTTAISTEGTVFDTNYFTSEAEAREGEKQEWPAEVQKAMEGFQEITGDVEWIDLKDPWLYSA
ncbi:MAG TPA: hypothetical protein VFA34_02215 [Actinomycetota bacterium]|jgi:hypothetical protein|nr:hypothetical protein [Actinomycetota bacterium]